MENVLRSGLRLTSLALALLGWKAVSQPAAAQSVRLTVRDPNGAKPVAGAFISLVDASGGVASQALTSELGQATLRASEGRFDVRIERPGFVDTLFTLTLGAGVESLTVVPPSRRPTFPLPQPAAAGRCTTAGVPESLAAPWGEAQKTLRVVGWGEDAETATLSLTTFDRDLTTSLKVESQEVNTILAPRNRPPNVRPGAEEEGYVVPGGLDSLGRARRHHVRYPRIRADPLLPVDRGIG